MVPCLPIGSLLLAVMVQPMIAQNLVVSSENLKTYLQNFSRPRSPQQPTERRKVQEFIKSFFEQLEIPSQAELRKQTFQTKDSRVNGTNFIFTIKGEQWGKGDDRIVIVGADYDSHKDTPGVDDNGSGMAAMLEIARLLSSSTTQFQTKYTVVFVAIDLQSFDPVGSKAFIDDMLVKGMLAPNASSYEVIILKCIMNYDTTPNSQKLYSAIELLFQETYKRVKDNKYRGDFQIVIGRSKETQMLRGLADHWNYVTNTSIISKLETIQLPDLPLSIMLSYLKEIPGDQINFWVSKMENLKAVVFTDTVKYRGYMKDCYQKQCDSINNVTPDLYQFLTCTTQTIFNYVFHSATGRTPLGYCGKPRPSGAEFAQRVSVISMVLALTLTICMPTLWDD